MAVGEVGQGTGGHVTGGAVVGDVITVGVVGQGVHVTVGVVKKVNTFSNIPT